VKACAGRRLGPTFRESRHRSDGDKTLLALSAEIIKIFLDKPYLYYEPDTAVLPHVATAVSIPEPKLLNVFTFILPCAKSTKRAEIELEAVMKSLQT